MIGSAVFLYVKAGLILAALTVIGLALYQVTLVFTHLANILGG